MSQRSALIVGAGIGGLTAALALAQRGWQVLILEQAEQLSALGAGIQLGPNAVRLLHGLGLEQTLAERGFAPEAIVARDWRSGRLLTRESLGESARQRWGAPYWQLHRADLQQILRQAVRETPAIELRLGAAVSRIDIDSRRVHTAEGRDTAHLIIGADGIHSRVRESLFGGQAARYTGQSAWRLLVPSRRLEGPAPPPEAAIWMGPGRHLVHYYLRGARLINCVAVVEKSSWPHESWTHPGDYAELTGEFAAAHPALRRLIEAGAEEGRCFQWGLFDRPPLPRWHRGAVALLGDACHPSLPFLAQGAAMAIEDALVLATCLAETPRIESALSHYTARRWQRCTAVQTRSRRNARLFHLTGVLAALRNLALLSGLASPARTTRWLYGFDALQAGSGQQPPD